MMASILIDTTIMNLYIMHKVHMIQLDKSTKMMS